MTPRAQALTDWARTYIEIERAGAHDRAFTRERLGVFARQQGFEPDQVDRAVDNAIKAASASQETAPA